jgi:preprotein translocase subunit SecD
MKFCGTRFNAYLLLVIAVGFLCGCSTEKSRQKKQLSSLRIHLEVNPDNPNSETATISHSGASLNVESEPFLTEVHVKEASVVDTPGGFAIEITFGKQGGRLLEQYTTANRGKHMAIFCRFVTPPDKQLNGGRWLGAPLIRQRIGNNKLTFTPEATREEAEAIAQGLTNIGKKLNPLEPKW